MQLYTPFGIRPVFAPEGVIRTPGQYTIESGYATTLYQFSPIAISAAGFVVAAAAGSDALGVFMGVEWTDTDGRRRYSNKWTASTVGTDIVAWITLFQMNYVYEVQADDTLDIDSFGQQYDWTALAGSLVTGLSSVGLDVSTAAANAGLRVVGLTPGPDNAWGDPFPVVQVQISEHPLVADVASL